MKLVVHIESVQSEDSNFFNKDMLAFCHLQRARELSLQDIRVYTNHFEENILPIIDGIEMVRIHLVILKLKYINGVLADSKASPQLKEAVSGKLGTISMVKAYRQRICSISDM